MAQDYGRLHRLMRIVTLLQTTVGRSVDEIIEICQVGERTFFRDLGTLRAAGIPICYDKQTKRYSILRSFFMPPVQLTVEESLALVSLGGRLAETGQIPFLEPARQAIEKVRGQLPSAMVDEAEELGEHVGFQLAASGDGEQYADVYQRVRAAIHEKRVMQCTYDSPAQGDVPPRTFEFCPYALFYGQRAWYVVGLHGIHGEIRTLKLARFAGVELTDRTYSIPETFSLKGHLGNAWRMIRGDRTYDIELWFDAHFADNIADTLWHPTQSVEWNDDHSITYRCKVDGLDEIVWWVLSMGPHCVVRQPVELADRVRRLARETLAHYEGEGGSDC